MTAAVTVVRVGAVIAKGGRAIVEKIQSDLTRPSDGKRGSEEGTVTSASDETS